MIKTPVALSQMNTTHTTNYILYKNPEQYDTLAIVQYLNHIERPNEPSTCIERGAPPGTQMPSILDQWTGQWYLGLANVVRYYEERSGITNLLNIAEQFKRDQPDYTIHKVGGRWKYAKKTN